MSAQLVVTDEPIQLFQALDAQLAQHPFGNSDYITQQRHVAYKRRLDKISLHLPVAGQLLEALSSIGAYGHEAPRTEGHLSSIAGKEVEPQRCQR